MDVRESVVVAAVIGVVASLAAGQADSGRRVVNFNGDWQFAKGAQVGAEKPDFDDTGWQTVRLPDSPDFG